MYTTSSAQICSEEEATCWLSQPLSVAEKTASGPRIDSTSAAAAWKTKRAIAVQMVWQGRWGRVGDPVL